MRMLPCFTAIVVATFFVTSGALAQQQQQHKSAKPAPPPQAPQAAAASPDSTARAIRMEQPQMGPTPGPGADTVPETPNPYAKDRAAMMEGQRLINWYNCAGCHGDHAGGGMGPSLRDSTWVYGGTDARIFNSIYQGRTKGMPSWGAKLPADQIWKIVAYIRSLRTANEPEKP